MAVLSHRGVRIDQIIGGFTTIRLKMQNITAGCRGHTLIFEIASEFLIENKVNFVINSKNTSRFVLSCIYLDRHIDPVFFYLRSKVRLGSG